MTKKIPTFNKIEDEATFWETHSIADYPLIPIDADELLEDLKSRHQKKENITFRLEPELMQRLKEKSKKAGVKYQTFVREWLWRAVA